MGNDIFFLKRHKLRRDGAESPIRVARALLRISQADLAATIGRDRSWISRLETGAVSASATEMAKIAQALELPVDSLFPEDDVEE